MSLGRSKPLAREWHHIEECSASRPADNLLGRTPLRFWCDLPYHNHLPLPATIRCIVGRQAVLERMKDAPLTRSCL